jgi:hypothetical protein
MAGKPEELSGNTFWWILRFPWVRGEHALSKRLPGMEKISQGQIAPLPASGSDLSWWIPPKQV